MVGVIAGIGFAVALFVAGEAFTDPDIQGESKTGTMLSSADFPAKSVPAGRADMPALFSLLVQQCRKGFTYHEAFGWFLRFVFSDAVINVDVIVFTAYSCKMLYLHIHIVAVLSAFINADGFSASSHFGITPP